jgi:hypothetical protein
MYVSRNTKIVEIIQAQILLLQARLFAKNNREAIGE